MLTSDEKKKLVSSFAVETLYKEGALRNGMKLGLGTGTTIAHVISSLAKLIHERKLKDIYVVPTSEGSLVRCDELNIPTYSLNSNYVLGHLDLAIDGADRIDSNKNMIKGGGAALLREKVVAYSADVFVAVLSANKKVENLNCDFPIPVEVLPFAYKTILEALKKREIEGSIREGSGKIGPTITDNGNYILDLHYPATMKIDAKKEEDALNKLVGVMENGLFTKANNVRVFMVADNGDITSY